LSIVNPPPGGDVNIAAPSPGRTTISLDVGTTVAAPPVRRLFTVYRSDLKLVLIEHLDRAKKAEWPTPLGLLATIVLTFSTAKFHAIGVISGDAWGMLYGIGGLCCAAWLLRILYVRKRYAPMTVDQLVDKCLERKDD
jgi:hypothetical protein